MFGDNKTKAIKKIAEIETLVRREYFLHYKNAETHLPCPIGDSSFETHSFQDYRKYALDNDFSEFKPLRKQNYESKMRRYINYLDDIQSSLAHDP